MTTEEKAKAYDMALEGARKELGVDRKEWEVVQRVLHNIFPQLAESEDERIRKELIELVRETVNEPNRGGITVNKEEKYIAWLEKQKELDKMIVVSPEVWDNAISDAFENGKKESEKQKEQKPAEWSEEDENKIESIKWLITTGKFVDTNTIRTIWKLLDSLPMRCPKKSDNWKPSEDEERLINTSISFLKDFADKGYENAVECIDWLKSKLNGNACK